MQLLASARSRACCSAGSSIAARIAMIAITTKSSISVKYRSLAPIRCFVCQFFIFLSLVVAFLVS